LLDVASILMSYGRVRRKVSVPMSENSMACYIRPTL
jgi:hypothetical protein